MNGTITTDGLLRQHFCLASQHQNACLNIIKLMTEMVLQSWNNILTGEDHTNCTQRTESEFGTDDQAPD